MGFEQMPQVAEDPVEDPQKAEEMAKSSGVSIGEVLNIQEGGSYSPIYPMYKSMMGGGGGMMQSGTTTNVAKGADAVKEEVEGKAVWDKLQSKQVTCADLKDDDFDVLADFFMGNMI